MFFNRMTAQLEFVSEKLMTDVTFEIMSFQMTTEIRLFQSQSAFGTLRFVRQVIRALLCESKILFCSTSMNSFDRKSISERKSDPNSWEVTRRTFSCNDVLL